VRVLQKAFRFISFMSFSFGFIGFEFRAVFVCGLEFSSLFSLEFNIMYVRYPRVSFAFVHCLNIHIQVTVA